MPLRAGDIVNRRYRIIRQLGQGGFATVYRAEDLSLKIICALKENLDYWEETQRQFEREAQMLAALRHPNLPRVIDYFTLPAEGQYLVMDYVEGYDLQEIIERVDQPVFETKALGWIDQICDALIYMHTQKPPIIHRDIKPANIKVDKDNRAFLVDFGVAKIYDPSKKTTMAARAVTPGYSPVEQYGHGTTDARADQYALAATLYILLTRERPPESIERVSGAVLEAPRQLNPAISPAVEGALLRALEVVASDRFESMAQFREALKASGAQSEEHIAAPPQPAVPPRNQAAPVVKGKQVSTPIARPVTIRPAPPSHKTSVQVEWVAIPAGEFRYGEEQRKLHLAAFMISRYPVTNQQYRFFLAANPEHAAPEYWKGRDFPMGKARHPVVGVSLQDAVDFCRWLGCRLPTEEEWEKAARGVDGRSYPWGEEWAEGKYCNNFDARLGGTTPVEKYSAGCSPFGAMDMAGNVWEWTASEHQGIFMHVLRGGSWREYSNYAMRTTARSWVLLGEMRDDLGFRLTK